MKAFLIDPDERSVTEVDYSGDYRQIYTLIGAECFTAAEFNEFGDVVYVDDEGLMKGPTSFFIIEGYPQPLAGKGLVIGTDEEGDSQAPSTDLEWLQSNVDFGAPVKAGDTILFVGDRNVRTIR